MAAAIAEATVSANLATKADLAPLATTEALTAAKYELVKWIVGIGIAEVASVITILKLFPATHG
jgi:hypothetical protein